MGKQLAALAALVGACMLAAKMHQRGRRDRRGCRQIRTTASGSDTGFSA